MNVDIQKCGTSSEEIQNFKMNNRDKIEIEVKMSAIVSPEKNQETLNITHEVTANKSTNLTEDCNFEMTVAEYFKDETNEHLMLNENEILNDEKSIEYNSILCKDGCPLCAVDVKNNCRENIDDILHFQEDYADLDLVLKDLSEIDPAIDVEDKIQPFFINVNGSDQCSMAKEIQQNENLSLETTKSNAVGDVTAELIDLQLNLPLYELETNLNKSVHYNNIKNIEKTETDFAEMNPNDKDDVISVSSEEILPYDLLASPLNLAGSENKINQKNDSVGINTITVKEDGVISLTSTESECSGYHSSDFEFITEDEAKMDLNTQKVIFKNSIEPQSPGPSTDNLENKFQINKWRNFRKPFEIDYSYRKTHVIPVGEDYLGLFQGMYSLAESEFQNKSTKRTSMLVQREKTGFDKRGSKRRTKEDDECKVAANESAKMIRTMYPEENRKRRRTILK